MEKMYKFYWDCGSYGSLEGLFVADEIEVKELIGKEVYFGEVLGKHSEIYGVIEEQDIQEVKVSEITIEEIKKALGCNISGYNPLEYIEE